MQIWRFPLTIFSGFRDGDSLHAIEINDFSDHHIFGNKFFEKHCDHDVKLGEGKCVKSGFEKNVRYVVFPNLL